jgi:hypothetical protein
VLARIAAGMDAGANDVWYRLCRYYRGDAPRPELGAASGDLAPDLAFGLAHHDLVAGDRARGMAALQQLARSAPWTAIGVIAAEAALQQCRLP